MPRAFTDSGFLSRFIIPAFRRVSRRPQPLGSASGPDRRKSSDVRPPHTSLSMPTYKEERNERFFLYRQSGEEDYPTPPYQMRRESRTLGRVTARAPASSMDTSPAPVRAARVPCPTPNPAAAHSGRPFLPAIAKLQAQKLSLSAARSP